MQSRIIGLLCPAALILVLATLCSGQALDTLKIKAEAGALKAQADNLRQTGNMQGALEFYQTVLEDYRQIDDKEDQVAILENIGGIHLNELGNYKEALSIFEDLLALHRAMGNRHGESNALYLLGTINLIYLNQNVLGLDLLNQSLGVARETGAQKVEARVFLFLGRYYFRIADYDSSAQCFKRGLVFAEAIRDSSMQQRLYGGLGLVCKMTGDFAQALDYFEKSQSISQERNDLEGIQVARFNRGLILGMLGDKSSLEIAKQNLENYRNARTLRDSTYLAYAYGGLAVLYADLMENPAQALQNILESLKLWQILGNQEEICNMTICVGGLYREIGNYDSALVYLQKGNESARELGDRVAEALALQQTASCSQDQQDYKQAIEIYQQALSLSQEIEWREGILEELLGLAQCYQSIEEDSVSTDFYYKAVEKVESARGQLQVESLKSTYSSKTNGLYADLILALTKSNHTSDAFHYSERGRARSFLDLLASAQVKVGKPKHQEFLSKEAEYADQKQGIEQQIASAGDDSTQAVALRGKLEGDWGEVLASLEEQKRQEPELASLVSVNPLTLPEVQKLLDKETTLLEYFLTEKKTLLWLVTRKNAEVFQVDIGGDSLKSLVMGFRKAIQDQSATDRISRQLYDLLIAPAAAKIKTDNLIIVPHGILHYLPFGALQDIQGRCLLEDYRIRYLPSASVLKYLVAKQKGNGERLLALGNPATDRKGFAAIPLTEMEVNEIGASQPDSRVLTGAQATETEFKRLAPQSDILHLACHGDLNSAYPMYSCLLLAPDSVEDGELDVHEIFNLDLHANLVVLSGCQTGLGHLTNGDELVGLSRAFIYAGTPSIVSSLWMVEDESTAYLMGRFYHHLQDHDKAQALRQAQLETRRKYPALRSWASFVLTGEAM